MRVVKLFIVLYVLDNVWTDSFNY